MLHPPRHDLVRNTRDVIHENHDEHHQPRLASIEVMRGVFAGDVASGELFIAADICEIGSAVVMEKLSESASANAKHFVYRRNFFSHSAALWA